MCRFTTMLARSFRADLLVLAVSALLPITVAADESSPSETLRTPALQVSVLRPANPKRLPAAPVAGTRPAVQPARPVGVVRPLPAPASEQSLRREPRLISPTFAPVEPFRLPSVDGTNQDEFRKSDTRPEYRSLPQFQTFGTPGGDNFQDSAKNAGSSDNTSASLSTLERLRLKDQKASDLQQVAGGNGEANLSDEVEASNETPILRLPPLPVSRSQSGSPAERRSGLKSSRDRMNAPGLNVREIQQTSSDTRDAEMTQVSGSTVSSVRDQLSRKNASAADFVSATGSASEDSELQRFNADASAASRTLSPIDNSRESIPLVSSVSSSNASSIQEQLAAKNAAAVDVTSVSAGLDRRSASAPRSSTESLLNRVVQPNGNLRDPGAEVSSVSMSNVSSVLDTLAEKNAAAADRTTVTGSSQRSSGRPQSAEGSRDRALQPSLNQRDSSVKYSSVSPAAPSSVSDQLGARNEAASDTMTVSGRSGRTMDAARAERQPGIYGSRDYVDSDPQGYLRVSGSGPGSSITTRDASVRRTEILTGNSGSLYEGKNFYGHREQYAKDYGQYKDRAVEFDPVSPGTGLPTQDALDLRNSQATEFDEYTDPGEEDVFRRLRTKNFRATDFVGVLNGVVIDPDDFTPGY